MEKLKVQKRTEEKGPIANAMASKVLTTTGLQRVVRAPAERRQARRCESRWLIRTHAESGSGNGRKKKEPKKKKKLKKTKPPATLKQKKQGVSLVKLNLS